MELAPVSAMLRVGGLEGGPGRRFGAALEGSTIGAGAMGAEIGAIRSGIPAGSGMRCDPFPVVDTGPLSITPWSEVEEGSGVDTGAFATATGLATGVSDSESTVSVIVWLCRSQWPVA